jgi:hypothetical protein
MRGYSNCAWIPGDPKQEITSDQLRMDHCERLAIAFQGPKMSARCFSGVEGLIGRSQVVPEMVKSVAYASDETSSCSPGPSGLLGSSRMECRDAKHLSTTRYRDHRQPGWPHSHFSELVCTLAQCELQYFLPFRSTPWPGGILQ